MRPPAATKIYKPIPTQPPLEGEELLNFSSFKGEIERGMGHKAVHIRANMSGFEKKYHIVNVNIPINSALLISVIHASPPDWMTSFDNFIFPSII